MADLHTHTHKESLSATRHTRAEGVWINVLREMRSFSRWGLSQHTHVTSLSGHFILLFKLFQTSLHSSVSGGSLNRETLQRLFLWFTQQSVWADLCQQQKEGGRAKKRGFYCFSTLKETHYMYCRFTAAGFYLREMCEFAEKTIK